MEKNKKCQNRDDSANTDDGLINAAKIKGKKLCDTVEETKKDVDNNSTFDAIHKLYELLECGDKRIELSAAKEILSLMGVPESVADENRVSGLEVSIKIVE